MSKRIFVDCYVFEGEFQGTRTFIKEIYSKIFYLESLKNKNERISFFLVCYKKKYIDTEFLNYEFVHYVDTFFKNRFLRLFFEYPYIILKNKIDFAHFQYFVPPIKLCKYILTIHDILFYENKKYFNFKYIFKNYTAIFFSFLISDFITTVSQHSKTSILNNFKFQKYIHITPNGVNELFFDYSTSLTKKDFLSQYSYRNYFLYVSRFEPRKNHINLLKAYIEGQFYLHYDLVLIGSKTLDCTNFYKYYNSLDNSIKNRVHIIHDGVNDLLLLNYYHFCEIFIYPSLFEGFGIPPLEASAMGKPVICSNLTAMSDFIFYNEYHINPTIDNLKNSIQLFITNNYYPNDLKNYIYHKYNWVLSANIFHTLYSTK